MMKVLSLSQPILAALMLALPPTAAAQVQGQPPDAMAQPACPRHERMQEHMERMHALHEAMREAASTEERARLRDQHMTLMREGMDMMGGTPGRRMGHGMMGHGTMPGGDGPCMAERMAMMETMMTAMMERMQEKAADE